MTPSINVHRQIYKVLTPLLLALLASLAVTSTALAHAKLERAEPADGAALAQPPREIRLWFDEPFLAIFSRVRMLDGNGQPMEAVTLRQDAADKNLMILTVPVLPAGVYVIRYNVISAQDGHFTRGNLVFGVGENAATAAAGIDTPLPDLAAGEVILRWLNFVTLAALAGAWAMVYGVLVPATKRQKWLLAEAAVSSPALAGEIAAVTTALQKAQRRVLTWAAWSGALAFGVGLALLIWQATELTSISADRPQTLMIGWGFLVGSRWGALWVARQVILLILTVTLFIQQRVAQRTPDPVAPSSALTAGMGVLVLALMAVQALTGHMAALTANLTPALIADTLHLLAAAIWVGGLLALAVGLLPLARRARRGLKRNVGDGKFFALVRAGWAPFSRLALASVITLVVTGLYSVGQQVASVDALVTTLYGQVLIGKVGLMLLVGVFGLINASLLHPAVAAQIGRLLRRKPDWTPFSLSRMPTLIVIETCLGLLLLLAVGLLTSLPPARGPEFAPPKPVQSALSQLAGELLVTLDAKPNRPGPNVITLRAIDTRRPAPAPVTHVTARFTFLGQALASPTTEAVLIEPGIYQVGGSYLNREGPWQIDVIVQRKGMPDSQTRFQWLVSPSTPARPLLISSQPLEPIITTVVLLLILLLGGLLLWSRLRRRWFALHPLTGFLSLKPRLRLGHKEE